MDITVDTEGINRLLKEIEELGGKKAGAIIRERTGLLARICAERTQPVADAGGGAITKNTIAADGGGQAAKLLGENAVRRDIQRVYLGPASSFAEVERREDKQTAKAFFKMMKTGQFAKARDLLASLGMSAKYLNIIKWDGGALHKRLRNSRGRIGRGTAPTLIDNAAELKRYIAKKVKMVGFMKSGWLTAARGVAGAKGIGQAAQWIKRHTAPGSASDQTRGENPGIALTNNAPGVNKQFNARQEGRAFEAVGDLIAKDLEKQIVILKNKHHA